MSCSYTTRKEGGVRIVLIDCENCSHSSSLLDENCRKNIFQILMKEADISKLILNHPFVKVFDGPSLNFLKSIAMFLEGLKAVNISDFLGEHEKCKACNERRMKAMEEIIEYSLVDPIKAFQKLQEEIKKQTTKKKPVVLDAKNDCNTCKREYTRMLSELIRKGDLEKRITDEKESDFYYMYEMQPYVRPIFFDTYIHLAPPPDAVFIKKYEVKRGEGAPFRWFSIPFQHAQKSYISLSLPNTISHPMS